MNWDLPVALTLALTLTGSMVHRLRLSSEIVFRRYQSAKVWNVLYRISVSSSSSHLYGSTLPNNERFDNNSLFPLECSTDSDSIRINV